MALQSHVWPLTCILFMMLWGGWISYKILAGIFKERLSGVDYFSLSSSAWVFPVFALSLLFSAGTFLFGEIAGRILVSLLLLFSLWFLFRDRTVVPFSLSFVLLTVLFAASLVLRLAFLQKALLPSYFDSAEHYRIIAQWLDAEIPVAGRYYHLGFHFLSASLVSFLNLRIADVMLLLGQVSLAVLPVAFFFPIHRLTHSDSAALFTVLLAGLGFHMPSHLVDWGKYPALLSLTPIYFVLNLYLLVQGFGFGKRAYWLMSLGVLLSFFIHTRSVVLFALILIAVFLTRLWGRLSSNLQFAVLGLLLISLAAGIFFMDQSTALKPLPRGYLHSDLWPLVLILFLAFPAFKNYPRPTFFLLTLFALLILSLFIPITFPGYGRLTLLDRPYVQALIYLPLSLLGGLGLAGLIQEIRRFVPGLGLMPALVGSLLCILMLFNASLHHEFYPSECCQLAGHDDMAAFAWMDTNLSASASVLIASSGLYVTSFESDSVRAGVDGGIWLTPLISRNTVLAWQGLNFDEVQTHAQLCAQGLTHLYVGGMPQSFDPVQLNRQPEWYLPVFSLPSARVYQVTGCN